MDTDKYIRKMLSDPADYLKERRQDTMADDLFRFFQKFHAFRTSAIESSAAVPQQGPTVLVVL